MASKRGPISWGVGIGKALPTGAAVDLAELSEELGYHSAWVSNERFHREMFVVLGAGAVRTRKISLGTFVVDPFTVHPGVSAAAVASVNELSGGRAILAVGAGGSGFPEMSISPKSTLSTMRKALKSFQNLLAGERVTVQDSAFSLQDAAVSPDLLQDKVPVVLASQSPRMLELGGSLADGVMISTFADPDLFAEAVQWARNGAVESGREFDLGRDVTARIDLAFDEDRGRARDALRPLIGYLLVLLHPRWQFLEKIDTELPVPLHEIAASKDFARMRENLSLIPDHLLDAFSWSGTPEEVVSQVRKLVDLGVRKFVILPHAAGSTISETVVTFARDVIPVIGDC